MSEAGKPSILSKDTLIPIGAIVVVAAAIVWVAGIYFQVQSHERTLNILMEKVEKISVDYIGVLDRLARIETKIDTLLKKVE